MSGNNWKVITPNSDAVGTHVLLRGMGDLVGETALAKVLVVNEKEIIVEINCPILGASELIFSQVTGQINPPPAHGWRLWPWDMKNFRVRQLCASEAVEIVEDDAFLD